MWYLAIASQAIGVVSLFTTVTTVGSRLFSSRGLGY